MLLDNFEVLATHPSQYGETEVFEKSSVRNEDRSSASSNPVQILSETIESRPEGELKRSDR